MKHAKSQSQKAVTIIEPKPVQNVVRHNVDIMRQFTSASNNILSARQSHQTQSERVSPRKVLLQAAA